jgi:hypothetical protein
MRGEMLAYMEAQSCTRCRLNPAVTSVRDRLHRLPMCERCAAVTLGRYRLAFYFFASMEAFLSLLLVSSLLRRDWTVVWDLAQPVAGLAAILVLIKWQMSAAS